MYSAKPPIIHAVGTITTDMDMAVRLYVPALSDEFNATMVNVTRIVQHLYSFSSYIRYGHTDIDCCLA
jgi:hypothetical protein